MNAPRAPAVSPWTDAAMGAALVAIDPTGLGGVVLRARPGPARDGWVALLRELLPAGAPMRRVPLSVPPSRLLGGLDLTATLAAGRPVAARGLLAEADGGVVLLPMAERLAAATAAHLAAALDWGEVLVERDGVQQRLPTRVAAVALDEGDTDEERPPSALVDRLALHVDLSPVAAGDLGVPAPTAEEVAGARDRWPEVRMADEMRTALCAAALALGVASLRASLLAARVARAAAALSGRRDVGPEDAALAARLVLAPRATASPPPEPAAGVDPAEEPLAAEEGEASDRRERPDEEGAGARSLEDLVLEAARAAIPAGLLARLRAAGGPPRAQGSGRSGAPLISARHGRPVGVRPGEPGGGARVDVVATLRAAAPWQRLRRRALGGRTAPAGRRRFEVRRDDFRVVRLAQRAETTTIFAVDGSGSSALHRLAEAKGAVELLLSECYIRRDRVALIAFRGRGAEILLSPTRSLVRARRSLASLPGGGGTPLAAGLDATAALADAVRRRGGSPVAVILTDGRANVARDGSAGRAQAEADALAAARSMRATGATALLVDTAPRPHALAGRLAAAMGAVYLPLPRVDAPVLSAAVRAAAAPARAGSR